MATNPYVNKVEFGNQTVMDLTGDTVEPSSVLVGETFHDRSGAPQTGTLSVDEFVTNDLLKDTVGWTGKNLLIQPYPKENTFPYGSNVVFTLNSDYTLTASGTTSSSSSYIILSGRLDNEETLKLPKGKYVFSGNALTNGSTYIQVYTTVNGSMYSIAATQNNYEVSFEITDELLVSGKDYCATGFLVGVVGNKTVTDVTFKPMVRHADVKNNTYEQYHENVDEELTTVKGDISDIEALIPSSASTSNKLATVNDIPSLTNYVEKSQTAGLLKNDGTVDTTQYVSDISGKADKVTSATNGDFAGLDSNGNLTDSGISADIIPSGASSSNKLATTNDIPTATVATTGSYYDLVDEPQNETADAGSNTVSLCTRREKYIWNQAASNRIKIHTQSALAGATSVYIQIDSANDHIVSVNADDGNDTIIKFKTMVFYGGGGSTAPMLYLTFSALAYDTTFEVLTV